LGFCKAARRTGAAIVRPTERRADNAQFQPATMKPAPAAVVSGQNTVTPAKTATDAEPRMILGSAVVAIGLILLALDRRRMLAHGRWIMEESPTSSWRRARPFPKRPRASRLPWRRGTTAAHSATRVTTTSMVRFDASAALSTCRR
jgi:hypothetical protein